ncbi:MAG: TlpA family protein disulfide reductase [Lysobacteraceae bacterium]|jgi:thiol-disulfide isomerase/thioredoxin|nr:TlpA disulfide reductase family protein [Silanimonas sp.]
MRKYIVGLLLLFFLYLAMRPELLPGHALPVQNGAQRESPRMAGGVCSAERCLTVYLAPWCPACRRAEPMVAELRQVLAREGRPVMVVIGMDEPAALEAHAREFGYPVLLDVDGLLKRDAGIRGVPYFIVTDRRGQVVSRQAGAFDAVEHNRQALGI